MALYDPASVSGLYSLNPDQCILLTPDPDWSVSAEGFVMTKFAQTYNKGKIFPLLGNQFRTVWTRIRLLQSEIGTPEPIESGSETMDQPLHTNGS